MQNDLIVGLIRLIIENDWRQFLKYCLELGSSGVESFTSSKHDYLLLNKFILLGFDENMVMEAISDVTSIVAAVTVTSAVSSIFAPIDDALKFVLLLASRISEFNLTFTYSR